MARTPEHLLITWNEKHMTNIKIIDEQHRGIVSVINSLHYALVDRHDFSLLHTYGEMAIDYLKIHFKTEIEILRAAHYPLVKVHHAHHQSFLAEGDHIFHTDFKKDGEPMKLLTFFKKFWKDHILKEDMDFSGYLIEHIKAQRRVIKKIG